MPAQVLTFVLRIPGTSAEGEPRVSIIFAWWDASLQPASAAAALGPARRPPWAPAPPPQRKPGATGGRTHSGDTSEMPAVCHGGGFDHRNEAGEAATPGGGGGCGDGSDLVEALTVQAGGGCDVSGSREVLAVRAGGGFDRSNGASEAAPGCRVPNPKSSTDWAGDAAPSTPRWVVDMLGTPTEGCRRLRHTGDVCPITGQELSETQHCACISPIWQPVAQLGTSSVSSETFTKVPESAQGAKRRKVVQCEDTSSDLAIAPLPPLRFFLRSASEVYDTYNPPGRAM